MKLTSQMPSSTSLMPSFWPASTAEMLMRLRCRHLTQPMNSACILVTGCADRGACVQQTEFGNLVGLSRMQNARPHRSEDTLDAARIEIRLRSEHQGYGASYDRAGKRTTTPCTKFSLACR